MTKPISVVVATTHPWPEIAPCLAALEPQVERLGGEIVVGDGDGRGVDPAAVGPTVRVVTEVGGTVFSLRALGLAAARGEVVALTEDHCVPSEDWVQSFAHGLLEEHPDVSAAAGATLNGSWESPFDRANFLMTFAETLPPLDVPQLTRLPPPSNVAIRRSAAVEAAGRPGALELELLPRLWAEGDFVLHRDAVVTHFQSRGPLETLAIHFANGRASAGLTGSLARDRSLLDWITQPAGFVRPVVRALAGKGRLRSEWAAVVILGALAVSHLAGEAVGRVRGPGRAAHALS